MISIDQGYLEDLYGVHARQAQSLISEFPVSGIIESFDRLPADSQYTAIPERVAKVWRSMSEQYGPEVVSHYQSVTLLELMKRFQDRARDHRYTKTILKRFANTFERITGHIEDPEFLDYGTVNDLFLKDLSLCRQKMFPAGARIIEEYSGLPRSLAFRAGPMQTLRFLRATILEAGGFKTFYQVHTHLLELDNFNERGWENMFLWLSQMMEINPHIRGVFCASWLYDPALEWVSPHLVYMRESALEKGATLLYASSDPDSGALFKSRTRRRLFQEGKYVPKTYYLVSPRPVALKWLRSQRKKDEAN